MKTMLLSLEDVKKSLSMAEVIEAVEEGYLAYEAEKVQQLDIVSMEIPSYNGETDIKSCYNGLNNSMSIKIASGFFDNGKINNLPTMIGMLLLLDMW